MRAKTLVALILVAMMLTPVQAGDVSVSQSEPAEDPKQPNANNTTMYMWSNGMATEWTHFNTNETESVEEGELTEEKANGRYQHQVSVHHGPNPRQATQHDRRRRNPWQFQRLLGR